jgi:FkbM family methyltransferase
MPKTGHLTAAQIAMASGRYVSPRCRVISSMICNEIVHFTLTDKTDVIQRSHYGGQFYEPEELAIIGKWLRPGAVFCDIGANIGNHTLFALKILKAAKSILFEPNPEAIVVLRANIEVNGLGPQADLSFIGIGLSDTSSSGMSMSAPQKNLGAARMVSGGGDIRTMRGDEALAGTHVDFIKMDIEGMEVQALSGLTETIARCRPMLFIEVDNRNAESFKTWVGASGYRIEASFQRYRTNVNHLVIPAD